MTLKIGDLLSGAATGLGVATASSLVNALFMSGRSIGGIIPDVVIEEQATDTLTITDHPVEQGAAITDHAFKNPAECVMRVGWSNSTSLVNSIVTGSILTGTINDVTDLYRQMLELQESRVPFNLVTGKRTYSNMLIKSITQMTDKEAENALMLTVAMRQVIIVQTSTVGLATAADHTDPQDTAAGTNGGTKQPAKATNQSALSALFGS